ncbi:MAG: hypothetical protein WAX77_00195 [Methylococcaceae bacterium]
MQNSFLSERTANDIDCRVAKILKDLDNPKPPLRLEDVRYLLQLDLKYYSSVDDGILQETLHRLTMSGKQLLNRPSLLIDAISKFNLKALWQPDCKRILLDSALPNLKQRWAEAHEIGHSILDWHEPMTHGDAQHTLSYSCHQQLEAEANFAAGRIVFLRDRFADELFSSSLSLASIKELSKNYGNTITSGLWRAVESLDIPAFAMVSQHPRNIQIENDSIRHFIRSPRFANEFSTISAVSQFERLASFCRKGRGNIGQSELVLTDDNGDEHIFLIECFFNYYDTLTLATRLKKHETVIAVSNKYIL